MKKPVTLAISLTALFFAVIAGLAVWSVREPLDTLTFNKDIAPIVFEHCVTCHRPGESAPFQLLSYEDVKKHAEQITEVTESGFMPPWLPELGYGKFVGERRLSELQIEIIRQWVEEGAAEGDPADLAVLPQWTDGWQLGQPDLVITLPEPFTLPGEGTDVYRNFVLPMPVSTMRYVKAVELRPGNKRIVHHAIMPIDRTGMTRQLDERDPGPGFAGMDIEYAEYPDGYFLGWTPGKVPDARGMSWRLHPGTDLLLQLHMVPTGKPEQIQPSVGLFFDETPRARSPTYMLIMKSLMTADIPAGEQDFEVTSEFVLPVDVQVALVYPHAHYLGKEVQGFATLPDGTTKWLIHIKDWDFNWQDSYRYIEPLSLPQDTVLTMKWTYDNSSDNVRNPNDPPQRVVFGNKTTDEMAHLYLQLAVRDERAVHLIKVAQMRQILQKFPREGIAHYILGTSLIHLDKFPEAVHHFYRALEAQPDLAPAHYNLGLALEAQQKVDEAIRHYREATHLNPNKAIIHERLAAVLRAEGLLDESIEYMNRLIELKPDDAVVFYKRGFTYGKLENYELALDDFRKAIELNPDFAEAYHGRGDANRALGNAELALDSYSKAIELRPDFAAAYFHRSNVSTKLGNYEQALRDLARLIELNPQDLRAHNNLASLLATCPDPKYRDGKQALLHATRACELSQWNDWHMLDTLAVAFAEEGQFIEAIKWQTKALELAPPNAKEDVGLRLELYQAENPYREE